jgi:hypothetical protein
VRLFRELAENDNGDAQYDLGVLYANGRGVPQDYILAHMWLNLSAAKGDQQASEARRTVAAQMSPEQLAEAQKLAREWKPVGHRALPQKRSTKH